MNLGPTCENLLCEYSNLVPDHGPATFITVMSTCPGNGLRRRESHVFLPAVELHLHELVYSYPESDDDGDNLKQGSRATHQLLADHLAGATPENRRLVLGSDSALAYRSTVLDEPPFRSFRSQPFLVRTMWQIQDWTHSDRLRAHLREATCVVDQSGVDQA